MSENLQSELSVFDPYVALVDGLTHKYDIVPDTSTVDGLAVVKAGIKDVGKVVRDIEKARKDKKSFYLKSGKAIDSKAKEVTVPFNELLEPMKTAKQEHDDKLAKAKQERIDKLQGKVDAIRNSVEFAQGKTSVDISKIIDEVDAIDPEDGFYDLTHEAIVVKNSTLNQLTIMLTEKLSFESSEKTRLELEEKQRVMDEENQVLRAKQKVIDDKIEEDAKIEAGKQAVLLLKKREEEIRVQAIEQEKADSIERENIAIAAQSHNRLDCPACKNEINIWKETSLQLKKENQHLKYNRDLLDMAESRENDVTRQAALLANALSDINNDIGEMKEVKSVFESVEILVSMYAGLEDCKKDPDV